MFTSPRSRNVHPSSLRGRHSILDTLMSIVLFCPGSSLAADQAPSCSSMRGSRAMSATPSTDW